MYDIKELEEKWERYNRKKKKPFYIIFWIFFLFILLAALAFYKQDLILSKFDKLNEKKDPEKITVFRDDSIIKLAIKSSLPTSTDIREKEIDDNPMNPEDVLPEVRNEKKIKNGSKKEKENAVHKKMHLEIIEITGESAYKGVKSRFEVAPDPDDSLFLARNYYNERKYSKAAYWALQTNKLNGNIEESWLIFAKAKAKIGKKNEAIRVLSAYVQKSGSLKAKKLLKQLKKK